MDRNIVEESRTDDGAVIKALLQFRLEFLKLKDVGDPRTWDECADGVLVTMTPPMRQAAEELRRLFQERFGRQMGPQDPLFFDPYVDTPVPFQRDHLAAALVRLAADIGMPASDLCNKLDWSDLLKDYAHTRRV